MTTERKFPLKEEHLPTLNLLSFPSSSTRTLKTVTLPNVVDLRMNIPAPVFDQGSLGSCTSNAACNALRFLKQTSRSRSTNFELPSRLFLYYIQRVMDRTPVQSDDGSYISTSVKALSKYGTSIERLWPYIENKFSIKPPSTTYTNAKRNGRISQFRNIQPTEDQMKRCLAAGFPFILGFLVYENFFDANETGYVPLPENEDSLLGGHAVLCVGYDNHNSHWILLNSWGSDWGDGGYFYIPYDYFRKPGTTQISFNGSRLISDLWVINK